jgi:hypothetical protein
MPHTEDRASSGFRYQLKEQNAGRRRRIDDLAGVDLMVLPGDRRFADRHEAAALLSGRLGDYKPRHPVILGIPRGGIVIADEVVCLLVPAYLYAIGQFFLDFEQVDDQEVMDILRAHSKVRRTEDAEQRT